MRTVYALHTVSWLAAFTAFIALFYSLLIFGVAVAIAATTWIAADLVGRFA